MIQYPTRSTDDRLNHKKIAVFPVGESLWPEEQQLVGANKWEAPKNDADWIAYARKKGGSDSFGLKASPASGPIPGRAGVAIVFPDGRVVVTEPTNHNFAARCFAMGGVDKPLKNTLRKDAQVARGLPADPLLGDFASSHQDYEKVMEEALRITAIKEAHEETGLQVRLVEHLGDFQVGRGSNSDGYYRMFVAHATGGSISDMGWETQSISLVPAERLVEQFKEYNPKRYKHPNAAKNGIGMPPHRKENLEKIAEAVELFVKNNSKVIADAPPRGLPTPSPTASLKTPQPPSNDQNGLSSAGNSSAPTADDSTLRFQNKLAELRDRTQQLAETYTNDQGAAPNDSGVQCLESGIVKVRFGNDYNATSHAIHANSIGHSSLEGRAEERAKTCFAVAGQSPLPETCQTAQADNSIARFLACERFLVQGIESGQGLYQFVSPRAHKKPEESRERPIIGQLRDQIRKLGNQNLILGERYRIESFEEQPVPPRTDGAMHDHAHWILKVTDLQNGQKKTVPLTQAGVTFANRLLDVRGIQQAEKILASHEEIVKSQANTRTTQSLPTIVSYAGIGRNATLITYRKVANAINAAQITTREKLDRVLLEEIKAGRQERGKRFLHSDQQIEVLRQALIELLENEQLLTAKCVSAATQGVARKFKNRSALFEEKAYGLRNNVGGGDCLFHSLHSNFNPALHLAGQSLSLSKDRVKEIRNAIANVIERMPDKPNKMGANWLAMADSIKWHGEAKLNAFYAKYAPMDNRVSNKDFAKFQREQGNTAGDPEIQQWLSLPENRNKTVVVIDGDAGWESIVTFTGPSDRNALTLKNISGDADQVAQAILNAITPALEQEKNPLNQSDPQHIALYRSKLHFQRIVSERFVS